MHQGVGRVALAMGAVLTLAAVAAAACGDDDAQATTSNDGGTKDVVPSDDAPGPGDGGTVDADAQASATWSVTIPGSLTDVVAVLDPTGLYVYGTAPVTQDDAGMPTGGGSHVEKRLLSTGQRDSAWGNNGEVKVDGPLRFIVGDVIFAGARYSKATGQRLGDTSCFRSLVAANANATFTTGTLDGGIFDGLLVKNDLACGNVGGFDASAGSDAGAISGIFAEGDDVFVTRYGNLVERHSATTGDLIWSTSIVAGGPSPSGIQTVSGSAIYVALTPGASIRALSRADGNAPNGFGSGGSVEPTLVNGGDGIFPAALRARSDGLFSAGNEARQNFDASYPYVSYARIEKRDLITGALVSAFADGGIIAFTGTGPNAYKYFTLVFMDVDDVGIYVITRDELESGFRIERRRRDTGAL